MNVIEIKSCSDINQYDLIVAGAGITGASLSYIAAHEYGMKVLVVEKSEKVGGLLSDDADGRAEFGCHYVHTNNEHVIKFLEALGEWENYKPESAIRVGEHDINLPVNDDGIEQLLDDSLSMLVKDRISAYLKDKNNGMQPSTISFSELAGNRDPYIRRLGKTIGEEVRKPLLKTFCAKEEGNVPVMFGIDRIRPFAEKACYEEAFQFYPRHGYSALIQKLLSQPSIDVCLNTDFNACFSVDELFGCIKYGDVRLTIPVVYTGRLDALYHGQYGSLPYLNLKKTAPFEWDSDDAAFDYYIRDNQFVCATRYPSADEARKTEAYCFQISDTQVDGAVDYIPKYRTSDIDYLEYYNRAATIRNFYFCGRLAEYRNFSIESCVFSAMETFSQIKFTHPISLLPNAVTYRRPMEQLLTPGNCFEKNLPYPSELIVGDLSRPLPEITVVIPTYKRKESLQRTLQSVLNQTVDPERYEILVVDNDPEDAAELGLFFKEANIPNLFYYRNSKNLGAYGNMNRCFELARTKWVSMVHDDDMLFSNALKWAMESIDFLKDPKLGAVIPRQVIPSDAHDFAQRLQEDGKIVRRTSKRLNAYSGKLKWKLDSKLRDIDKRRFWRISRLDCYFVPFLYPAPSYGTLINRDALLEIGGFGEGYPLDDNFCFNRLAEKYHVYLCGEAWGLYSFETADVLKPRAAMQFVDCLEQFRRYMQKHNQLCRLAGKIYNEPSYIYSVDDDFNAIKNRYGYCTNKSNYSYYDQYSATAREIVWSKRIRKTWDFMILARTCVGGKKVTRDLISRAGGEHL